MTTIAKTYEISGDKVTTKITSDKGKKRYATFQGRIITTITHYKGDPSKGGAYAQFATSQKDKQGKHIQFRISGHLYEESIFTISKGDYVICEATWAQNQEGTVIANVDDLYVLSPQPGSKNYKKNQGEIMKTHDLSKIN